MDDSPEPVLTYFQDALTETGRVIARIHAEQWDAPTPCEEMSVGTLIEHMVGGLLQFATVPTSADPTAALTPPAELDLTIDEALAAFDNAGQKMLAAWKDPATTNADYDMPWGATPGAALVGFMLIEVVTHGWDLAKATDQAPAFDEQLVLTTLEIAKMYDDEAIRVPGMFGPIVPVADDAPLIDQLAGFLGRHP